MRYWTVMISPDRYEAERVYHSDVLDLGDLADFGALAPGDRVAVVAGGSPPVAYALGEVRSVGDARDPEDDVVDGRVVIAYTKRFIDLPRPVAAPAGAVAPLDEAVWRGLAGSSTPPRTWLVSLDLPIEAATAADAARQFWSYIRELGPRELPTFVSPTDDVLAMQALVAGEPVNLDPEED
jgi:hypothetical protein